MNQHEELPSSPGQPPPEDDWGAVAVELRALSARFDRKISDDGDKHRLIEELHSRVRAAEQGQVLEYLGPMIYRVAMVLDRLDRHLARGAALPDPESPNQTDFVESIRSELLSLLHQHQVEHVAGTGPVDPSAHEVVEVRGNPSNGESSPQVLAVVRRGFRYRNQVLRPAQVVAGYPVEPG